MKSEPVREIEGSPAGSMGSESYADIQETESCIYNDSFLTPRNRV